MKRILILCLSLVTTGQALSQIQTINLGTSANDRTGDPIRTAFQKTNANFTYVDGLIDDNAERIDSLVDAGPSISWGDITGTLSNQTDLHTAIDAKVADAINDGTTTVAPSQNAVYDADLLKIDKLIVANRQTSHYTLVLADAVKIVEMNSASANNLTVPPNSSVAFPIGTQIIVSQYGAGQTTFVAGVGVTIRSEGGKLDLVGQYAAATLLKIGENEWYLFGAITD